MLTGFLPLIGRQTSGSPHPFTTCKKTGTGKPDPAKVAGKKQRRSGVAKALSGHARQGKVGRKAKGWLSSSLRGTLQTADILAEYGCTFYCDIMNDDQPYLLRTLLRSCRLAARRGLAW